MINLDGKKALITGGSRGIRRATAILFARAGADVAINFLSHEQAALEVKQEVNELGRCCDIAGPILFLVSDLARHITGEVINVNSGSLLCA